MTLPTLKRTGGLKASVATVLGYGPAGAGKTRSILTLLERGLDPIILATELGETHGLLSLAGSDIPYVELDSHQQTIEVLKSMKRKKGKVEYDGTEFGAVVLDSITQWGEYPLERYMQLKGWSDLHGPNAPGSGKDPRTAYGFLAEKGRQLYKELFELEAHLYVIAREGLFGGGDVALFSAPELPGQKLPREVPGWPDATIRLRVVAGQHRMITTGEGGCPARIRLPESFPKLPSRCNPDIGALMLFMCGDQSMHEALLPPKAEKPGVKKTEAAPTTPSS